MKRTRILLADDHTLLLEALQKLLEPEFEVVGRVADGRTLLAAALDLRPDVIVIDIVMPLLNGLDALTHLKHIMPEAKLIVLTMQEDPELAAHALRMGASGYLFKRSAASALVHAIRQALRGGKYVAPEVASALESSFVRAPHQLPEQKRLTVRQREVLQLLAEGRTMKEVAGILHVTPRTIAFHKYRMMDELAINSSAALVQYAVRNHLIAS